MAVLMTWSGPVSGRKKPVLVIVDLMRPGLGGYEVLSRDRLLNEVWGCHYGGTTRTLDQTVVQVRKKTGDSADSPRHLLTVHGVGYRLIG